MTATGATGLTVLMGKGQDFSPAEEKSSWSKGLEAVEQEQPDRTHEWKKHHPVKHTPCVALQPPMHPLPIYKTLLSIDNKL